jgi:hypothetical protein
VAKPSITGIITKKFELMDMSTIKILSIAGLIMALAVVASISPTQSQAMLPEVGEQSQVIEQQTSSPGNATATITITMTGIADDSMK